MTSEDTRFDGGVAQDEAGADRPAFVDPNVEQVRCHFCDRMWDPSMVDGFDIAQEKEYYPNMVPVCPEHAGGCR